MESFYTSLYIEVFGIVPKLAQSLLEVGELGQQYISSSSSKCCFLIIGKGFKRSKDKVENSQSN